MSKTTPLSPIVKLLFLRLEISFLPTLHSHVYFLKDRIFVVYFTRLKKKVFPFFLPLSFLYRKCVNDLLIFLGVFHFIYHLNMLLDAFILNLLLLGYSVETISFGNLSLFPYKISFWFSEFNCFYVVILRLFYMFHLTKQ